MPPTFQHTADLTTHRFFLVVENDSPAKIKRQASHLSQPLCDRSVHFWGR